MTSSLVRHTHTHTHTHTVFMGGARPIECTSEEGAFYRDNCLLLTFGDLVGLNKRGGVTDWE